MRVLTNEEIKKLKVNEIVFAKQSGKFFKSKIIRNDDLLIFNAYKDGKHVSTVELHWRGSELYFNQSIFEEENKKSAIRFCKKSKLNKYQMINQ